MPIQHYSPLPNDGNSAHLIAVPPPPAQDDIDLSADDEVCMTEDKLWLEVFACFILFVGTYKIASLVLDAYNNGAYDVEVTHISGLNTTSPTINTDISFVIEAHDPHEHRYDDMQMYVDLNGDNIGAGVIPLGSFHTTPFSMVISSGPWTLNLDTLDLLANNAQNLPLSVSAYARHKSHGEPFNLHCKMTVDLTHTNGTQLTYHRCENTFGRLEVFRSVIL